MLGSVSLHLSHLGELLAAILFLCVAALIFCFPRWGLFLVVASTPFESVLNAPFLAVKAFKLLLVAITAAGLLLRAWTSPTHRPTRRDPYLLFFFLLLFSALIATLLAQSPSRSAIGLAELILMFGYYFAVSRSATIERSAAAILRSLVVLSVPMAILALAQSVVGYGGLLGSHDQKMLNLRGAFATAWPMFERAAATFGSNNAAGAFFSIVTLIAGARCLIVRKLRAAWATTALLSGLAAIATFSRGAIGGLVCGVIFLGWVLGLKGRRFGILLLILSFAIGVFTMLPVSVGITYFRLGNALNRISSVSPTRFKVWSEAWSIIKEKPLAGIGFYSFRQYIAEAYQVEHPEIHAHNALLNAVVEQGVVGGAAYVLFIFLFLRTTLSSLRRSSADPLLYWIYVSIGCAGVCLFGQEMVDAGLTIGGSSLAILFTTLYALQVSLMNSVRRMNPESLAATCTRRWL